MNDEILFKRRRSTGRLTTYLVPWAMSVGDSGCMHSPRQVQRPIAVHADLGPGAADVVVQRLSAGYHRNSCSPPQFYSPAWRPELLAPAVKHDCSSFRAAYMGTLGNITSLTQWILCNGAAADWRRGQSDKLISKSRISLEKFVPSNFVSSPFPPPRQCHRIPPVRRSHDNAPVNIRDLYNPPYTVRRRLGGIPLYRNWCEVASGGKSLLGP
jgi:hypothetical protein